jgi:Erv1 / Alr family
MNTLAWGPSLWNYSFMMCRNYPVELDESLLEHRKIKKSTIAFYSSFPDILPCKYCRASFKGFIKEMPIKNYLKGREDITYWLYLMKDKVNTKLINQEKKLFEEELAKLTKERQDKGKKVTKKEVYMLKNKIFITIPTPPFFDVVEHFEQFRAGCSPKSLSCRESKLSK